MAARIVGEFKQRISRMVLVPSDGGRFEIETDGELIYSKLSTGSFPEEETILEHLRGLLAARPR